MNRILHVKHTLGYDGATIIEYRIAEILEGKMVFDWMLTGLPEWVDQDYVSKFTDLGSKIFFCKPFIPPFKNWKWNELAEVWHYYRIFRELNYDVAYCDTDNPERVKLLLGAMLAGVKRRVLHSHNSQREGCDVPPKRLKVYKWLMKFVVTDYLACSSLAAKWMFPDSLLSRTKIVQNGLETDKFKFDDAIRNRVRMELGIPQDAFVVGHVGRFVEQKNHRKIISVFNEIYKRNASSVLILIGDGTLKPEIEHKMADLGLTEKVFFITKTNEVEKYYQAMDVFLLPSLHEGMCMTCIEAQTSGLNCVLSDRLDKDLNMSGACRFVALDDNDVHWAEVCLSQKTVIEKRLDGVNSVINAGYDIKNTAEMVCELFKD